jgi:hypothetical protein
MVELIALMGRVALRLHSTVVEIGYYVKRVVAAKIAAIRVDVQQNYAPQRRAARAHRQASHGIAVLATVNVSVQVSLPGWGRGRRHIDPDSVGR